MIKLLRLGYARLHTELLGNFRVLKNCKLKDSNGSNIFLNTQYCSDPEIGIRCLSTDIFDSNGQKKAYNTFEINNETREFSGFNMNVIHTEDRQKHGYGEVLRLSSIIELMENNLKKIAIFSLNNAIPFHYKYKFKPVIFSKDEAMSILNEISYEKNPVLEKQRNASIKLLDEMIFEGQFPSSVNTGEKFMMLLNEYLSEVQKNKIPWFSKTHIRCVNLTSDLSMELDRDTILKNKNYFNQLFEKHGFDYRL